MLDEKAKPWLIEVNHSPSFTTDTSLDHKVKLGVTRDAMSLIGLNVRTKGYNQRNYDYKVSHQQRKQIAKAISNERSAFEEENQNGFKRIFPAEGYDSYLNAAKNVWIDHAIRRRRP